jgi:acetoin utilization deacetylase AcuC-like enzyme
MRGLQQSCRLVGTEINRYKTAYGPSMVRVFYSPLYVRSAVDFDTTRKAKWIADSLTASPISGIELVEPQPLSRDQLALIHSAAYVGAVETGAPLALAESQGFSWDAGLWPMVLASNGGVVAAGLAALEDGVAGSLSSGLHHARHDRGAGYCTFNGLVLSAYEALAAGARSVLILDLDAHCGGGTSSMMKQHPQILQVDVSVNDYDKYTSFDSAWLEIVENSTCYLSAIDRMLETIDKRNLQFDLCLYNAGMDPCENCPIGGMAGITKEVLARRERWIFSWCRDRHLPIAFVLAGGYSGPDLGVTALIALHRLTLSSAAETT